MKILSFLAALFVCLPGYAGEAVCGISLGIRDNAWVDAGMRKDWPLAFRVRNLQATPLAGSALPGLFSQGEVHLASASKEWTAPVSTGWRTMTHDLAKDQVFECPGYGDLRDYFPGTGDGDYSIWWTLGKQVSNRLRFSVRDGQVALLRE